METFGGSIDLFWNLVNIEAEKGTVHTVIDHLWFSGICSIFIVINANAGRGRIIIHKKVIADAKGTDLSLHKASNIMGGKLGNNTSAKSQQGSTYRHV